MKTFSIDLPTMYGDHHVTEVRRLMLELPGVTGPKPGLGVYASSCFQVIEVQYDETKLDPEEITAKLEEAGYLGDMQVPVEKGALSELDDGDKPYFRNTAVYEQTGSTVNPSLLGRSSVVSFAQQVPHAGRPLWPCPGMGPIHQTEEEVTNG